VRETAGSQDTVQVGCAAGARESAKVEPGDGTGAVGAGISVGRSIDAIDLLADILDVALHDVKDGLSVDGKVVVADKGNRVEAGKFQGSIASERVGGGSALGAFDAVFGNGVEVQWYVVLPEDGAGESLEGLEGERPRTMARV
jgi:hypothetical protein